VKEEDEVNMEVTLTDTPKSDTTIQENINKKDNEDPNNEARYEYKGR